MKKKALALVAVIAIPYLFYFALNTGKAPVAKNKAANVNYKTEWKNFYKNIDSVANQIKKEHNGSFVNVFSNDIAGSESLKDAFKEKLGYTKDCSAASYRGGKGRGASVDGCWHGDRKWTYLNGSLATANSGGGFIMKNGAMVVFQMDRSDCTEPAGAYKKCGSLHVDVNGMKEPNTIGVDIFGANITKNGLMPFRAEKLYDPEMDCNPNNRFAQNRGWGCSAKYLAE